MLSENYRQFDALGDSNRMRILELFTDIPELTPTLICQMLGLSTPLFAHHLRILKAAKLINVKKSGRVKMLSLNKDEFQRLAFILNDIVKG